MPKCVENVVLGINCVTFEAPVLAGGPHCKLVALVLVQASRASAFYAMTAMKCSRAQRKKTKATAKATADVKKRRQVTNQKYKLKKAEAQERYVRKRMGIAEKSGRKYVPRAHGPRSIIKRQMAEVNKKLDQGVLAGIVFFQMVWPGFSICLHPDGCKA